MDIGPPQLTIIDFDSDRDKDIYKNFITNKLHNPYYHSEYLLCHKTDSNKVISFMLVENGECIGIMPMILDPIPNTEYSDAISLYGYQGPLFKEGLDKSYIDFFWTMVDEWYKNNKVVTEFVRFSLDDNHVQYSGNLVETLKNVSGQLKESFDEQWESFSRKVRNNFRKAQTFNLTFKLFKGENLDKTSIANFYKIYHSTMVRKNASKFLYFSLEFFDKLILNNRTDFTIGLVYKNGQPISTELHYHANNTIYAFLGGSDSNFFHTRPNDFLRVKVIEWAISNKKNKYILGGGIRDNDSLYKSKKAFFPKDEDCIFYTGRKIINQEVYDSMVEKAIRERNLSKDEIYFPLYKIPEPTL